jgi:hypothetical protein
MRVCVYQLSETGVEGDAMRGVYLHEGRPSFNSFILFSTGRSKSRLKLGLHISDTLFMGKTNTTSLLPFAYFHPLSGRV